MEFIETLPPDHARQLSPKALVVVGGGVEQSRTDHVAKRLAVSGWSVKVAPFADAEMCRHEMQTARAVFVYGMLPADVAKTLGEEGRRLGICMAFDGEPPADEMLGPPTSARRRVLVVNILYAPVSYGGATVLVENLVAGFNDKMDVAVFSTTRDVRHAPWHVLRYSHAGVPCFVCETPFRADSVRDYKSPEVATAFAEVLEAFRPDVVHFNSIHSMGVEMLAECRRRNVPYCVTVHDSWWICPRQFRIDGNGRFCGQGEEGIDLEQCAKCTKRQDLSSRRQLLRESLAGAFAVLAPSDYQRNLYVRNGIPAALVQTCRNGIAVQANVRPHQRQPVLTFGYLGGKCDHKGYYMLQRIVKRLHGDWRLKVVDLERRFNRRSVSALEWAAPSRIEVCMPFDPGDIDAFYAGLDVILAPSCMPESFGLTVREALARNVWVIATDAGGDIGHDLVSGENGDLVPLGDEKGFESAMRRLIDHPERLDGFENPRRKTITTVAQQVDGMLGIMETAINHGSSQ